jgi:hypothetical protein
MRSISSYRLKTRSVAVFGASECFLDIDSKCDRHLDIEKFQTAGSSRKHDTDDLSVSQNSQSHPGLSDVRDWLQSSIHHFPLCDNHRKKAATNNRNSKRTGRMKRGWWLGAQIKPTGIDVWNERCSKGLRIARIS